MELNITSEIADFVAYLRMYGEANCSITLSVSQRGKNTANSPRTTQNGKRKPDKYFQIRLDTFCQDLIVKGTKLTKAELTVREHSAEKARVFVFKRNQIKAAKQSNKAVTIRSAVRAAK